MVHHIDPDPVAVRGSGMSVSSRPRLRRPASIVPMPGTTVHESRRAAAQEDEAEAAGEVFRYWRKRSPSRCAIRRTTGSGVVSRPLIPAIISLRRRLPRGRS